MRSHSKHTIHPMNIDQDISLLNQVLTPYYSNYHYLKKANVEKAYSHNKKKNVY